jgi:Protein of unknown function (DUF998)
MEILALLTIGSGMVSLFCLLVLHFISPEFHPSWRMVSEYALGKHKGVLTAFFIFWGLSSLLLAALLWSVVSSIWAIIGLVLLVLSGIGAIMGGLFDVNHRLHGLSFGLGVPTFIVASLLIGYHLVSLDKWTPYRTPILVSAHSIWISCILMGVSMSVMFAGFKKAGVTWDKDAPPPTEVPEGVIALGGYANRFLVVCYELWTILIAILYIKQS